VAASQPSKGNPGPRADLDLVKSAIAKKQLGRELSKSERRALVRYDAEQDERRGRRFIAAVPKKTYCEFAGRQTKVLHEQADAYGIPLRGATIDLAAVIRWLHDFLAEHKYALPAIVSGEDGATSPRDKLTLEQIEVYKRRVVLLEQKIAREEAMLIPRHEIHELLVQLAKVLRGAGERLHKQYGEQAASILDAALSDYESTIMQLAVESKSDENAPPLKHGATADD
jgi:hypothetical protein